MPWQSHTLWHVRLFDRDFQTAKLRLRKHRSDGKTAVSTPPVRGTVEPSGPSERLNNAGPALRFDMTMSFGCHWMSLSTRNCPAFGNLSPIIFCQKCVLHCVVAFQVPHSIAWLASVILLAAVMEQAARKMSGKNTTGWHRSALSKQGCPLKFDGLSWFIIISIC